MLTSKNKTIAKFQVEKLFGNTGMGIYRLFFHTRYTIHSNKEENYILNNFSTNISVTNNSNKEVFLGVGIPEKPFSFRNSSYDNEGIANFILSLTNEQIEQLEGFRNGADLQFKLMLSCDSLELKSDSFPVPLTKNIELSKNVNQSEWIECLDKMDYGKYTLFEVPIVTGLDHQASNELVNDLNKARTLFLKGEYDLSVATCRIALDVLTDILNDNGKIRHSINVGSVKNHSKDMEKEERFYYVRHAIRNLTHLGVHPNKKDRSRTPFNRYEAQYILALTASTISLFVQKLSDEEKT